MKTVILKEGPADNIATETSGIGFIDVIEYKGDRFMYDMGKIESEPTPLPVMKMKHTYIRNKEGEYTYIRSQRMPYPEK